MTSNRWKKGQSGNPAGRKSIMMKENAPVSQPATPPPASTETGTPSKSQ